MSTIKAITVITILVPLISLWYSRKIDNHSKYNKTHDLDRVLQEMIEIEKNYPVGNIRVAVGYGACKDIFVPGNLLLGPMTPPEKKAHYNRIENLKQLKEMYSLFFSAGSAAERFISNEILFQDLLIATESMSSSYSALGGNAPVMASRFAKEGAQVLLAAKPTHYLLTHIPKNVRVIGAETDDELDDIHLIIEYKVGEIWGPYEAKRANRFIVHSDESNPTIDSAEKFGMQLKKFSPHLLVVGGLQMMDNFPFEQGEREKRLSIVRDQMSSMLKKQRVHFEMASFSDANLLKDLKDYIIPYADSLGMNEQELPNLYSLLKYGNVSLVSDSSPRVAVVLDLMRDIFSLLSNTVEEGQRQLTRLHVHTLAFQAIMIKKDSAWVNTKAAANKAALVANRHVCGNNEISLSKAKMLMDDGFTKSLHEASAGRIFFDDSNPVSCWNELDDSVEVCVAPVLVCTKVFQTAGGGDNISAAGLLLSLLST